MSTATRIGPRDQGREMTYEEFLAGDYEEGSKYELIEGRLCVSPHANFPHDWLEDHVKTILMMYRLQHPNIVKRVSPNHESLFQDDDELRVPNPILPSTVSVRRDEASIGVKSAH